MNAPEVSICVATLRNHSLHLTKLLLSIERNTTVAYEVIIVSGGGTVRGYTAPMNQALRAAVSPLVACLNDDVEVSEGWLEPLLSAARAGAWAVTPDMTHTDGPQVYAPYCLLLRREALEQVGDLDERFVVWASDIDYAQRLIDAGHRPVKVPLANPIIHHVSATSDVNPGLDLNAIQQADLERYRQKWGEDANAAKGRMAQEGIDR